MPLLCTERWESTPRPAGRRRPPSRLLLALTWLGGSLTAYLCFCRVEQVPAVCEEALARIQRTCGLDRARALRFLRVRSESTGHGLEESCRHLVEHRRTWPVRTRRLMARRVVGAVASRGTGRLDLEGADLPAELQSPCARLVAEP